MKYRSFIFRIPDDLYQALQRQAEKEGRPMSRIIKEQITEYLKELPDFKQWDKAQIRQKDI